MGELKAAAKPLCPGLLRDRLGLQGDLLLQREQPLVRRVSTVGSWNADERSASGSSIDGQGLEELHAAGEVVDREAGGRLEQDAAGQVDVEVHLQRARARTDRAGCRSPPCPRWRSCPRGRGRRRAGAPGSWCRTRRSWCSSQSSFMMPPTSPADTSPPNILPLIVTPIESMPMIGNLPSSSSDGWMRMPWIAPGDLQTGQTLDARDARREDEDEVARARSRRRPTGCRSRRCAPAGTPAT